MVEQCKGERGPEPGDRRSFMCSALDSEQHVQAWERDGWRFLHAKSAPVAGRGLPRMVTVTMEYSPDE